MTRVRSIGAVFGWRLPQPVFSRWPGLRLLLFRPLEIEESGQEVSLYLDDSLPAARDWFSSVL